MTIHIDDDMSFPDGAVDPDLDGVMSARARFSKRLFSNGVVYPAIAVVVIALAGIFAPWLAPYDPLDQDLGHRFAGPSSTHWLGTDNFGRDVFSRLIFGARIALVAIAEGVGVAVLIGVPVGVGIGYRGGWWDRIVMRVVETVVSIPGIMLAIVVVTILGTGLTNAMIALGILFSTQFIRLCRGLVIAEREEEYVRAAWVLGASPSRITVRHLLPNIAGPIIVQITLTCGAVLLAEAGLSFLGLAVQPPEASWGTMLTTASEFIAVEPWQAIAPGAAIFVAVLAINLLGDAIRDSLGRDTNRSSVVSAARPAATAPTTHRSAEDAEAATSSSSPGASARDEVLAISDLEIQFPTARGDWCPVVTGVSLTVRAGETLGLVGESGSGKSVTALAALGLVPAPGAVIAGSVEVDGRNITGASPKELTAIRGTVVSMVFQDPMASMNPAFRVGRQLAESLRVKLGLGRADAKRRAIELLDMVGIPEPAARARDFPHEFSGGMVQRIAIARALSCDPALLIADEPTTALDVTVQAEILGLLRTLQADLNMALLFISHDLGVVAEICDRAAVMYAGEIVEEASVDELLTRPRHPYTEALLGSVPHSSNRTERLPTIPGTVPKPGSWQPGCRFAPRCSYAEPECATRPELRPEVTPDGGEAHAMRCWRSGELSLRGVSEVADAARG